MEIAGSYWETLLSFTIKLLVKGGGVKIAVKLILLVIPL